MKRPIFKVLAVTMGMTLTVCLTPTLSNAGCKHLRKLTSHHHYSGFSSSSPAQFTVMARNGHGGHGSEGDHDGNRSGMGESGSGGGTHNREHHSFGQGTLHPQPTQPAT